LIPIETNPWWTSSLTDIDPFTLSDHYSIGFGFYYKFLLSLPARVEQYASKEDWLGIAGLSETVDYGNDDTEWDRAL
jgi:hypothetical protein